MAVDDVVNLFFDGSCCPNPGVGSWGAYAKWRYRSYLNPRCIWSAQVGITTNNGAEYLGLIGGLRGIIRACKAEGLDPSNVVVNVRGDSEIVIRQVLGQYMVRSEKIYPFFHIAHSLTMRFLSCYLFHVPREHNSRADALARNATAFYKGNLQTYRPRAVFSTEVWIQGVYTRASNDFFQGNDDNCYISVKFLRSFQDNSWFRKIQDEKGLTAIDTPKSWCTALGSISLRCHVETYHKECGTRYEWEGRLKFVVVESLPTNIHLANSSANFIY